MNNRGQLWTEFFYSIMILAIVGMLYIVLDQVFQYNLKPQVLKWGVHANNAATLESAWAIVLLFVAFAFIYGMIDTARKKPSEYGYNL